MDMNGKRSPPQPAPFPNPFPIRFAMGKGSPLDKRFELRKIELSYKNIELQWKKFFQKQSL